MVTKRYLEENLSHFFSGMNGGMSSVLFGFPFDTIKVRQQTIENKKNIGIIQCYQEIVKYHGYKGLFRGMSYPIFAVGMNNSLFFGIYGSTMQFIYATRKHFGDDSTSIKKPPYMDMVYAGFFAGTLQAIPATPIELVKTKLQVQRVNNFPYRIGTDPEPFYSEMNAITQSQRYAIYNGPTDCIRQIYRKHGIRALFKGLYSTILRDAFSFGFYIVSYEMVCDMLTKENEKRSIGVELFAGGIAGMVSWFNMPHDMIKSRIQADHFVKPKYPTYASCYRDIYAHGGYSAFFRGFPVTLIRAFPTNAITIFVYNRTHEYVTARFNLQLED